MTEDDWYLDRSEVVEVGRMLVETDYLTNPTETLDYIEKPWKWTPERDLWVAAGRPDPTDPGWALFQARIDARELAPADHS
jgi:hypothetical protein